MTGRSRMTPREAELWVAKVFLEGFEPFRNVPPSDMGLIATNRSEVYEVRRQALHKWAHDHDGLWPSGGVRLPPETPRLKVMLPIVEYAPDIVNTNGLYIVSAKLRYVMALPDPAVQYLPIEIIDGSDLAYTQDYRWMAYLASFPVLDMQRSEYDFADPLPFQRFEDRDLAHVHRFVVRDDFEPSSGLFRMHKYPSTFPATEALARRVERAGCTGLRFADVDTQLQFGVVAPRYRASSRN